MAVDLNAAEFTASELREAAGLDLHVTNIWLQRQLLEPTKAERLNRKTRQRFSIAAIFQARMMRLLAEHVGIGPLNSKTATSRLFRDFVRIVADESMWPLARGMRRGKPIKITAAIWRTGETWKYRFFVNDEKVDSGLGPEAIVAVVPVSEIFTVVFEKCEAIRYARSRTAVNKRARRARS
jgi:hypothetical protein